MGGCRRMSDISSDSHRHWLIIHPDGCDENGNPDNWEIEHESCLLVTEGFEEEVYEDPTPEELADDCKWRILRPTGRTRVVFTSRYCSDSSNPDNICLVENEIDNIGIEAFGDTSRTTSWVDVTGERHWETEYNLWPGGLPREPGRYEIAFWVHYYPGEYGGMGDCDCGLRLVELWYNIDGACYDLNSDEPMPRHYGRYSIDYGFGIDLCHWIAGPYPI